MKTLIIVDGRHGFRYLIESFSVVLMMMLLLLLLLK
jgi:hypothetical protein